MSEKHKKTCRYVNYVENLLILLSAVTGCVLVSAFASLVFAPVDIRSSFASLIFVPVDITSSAIGVKICAITAGI